MLTRSFSMMFVVALILLSLPLMACGSDLALPTPTSDVATPTAASDLATPTPTSGVAPSTPTSEVAPPMSPRPPKPLPPLA